MTSTPLTAVSAAVRATVRAAIRPSVLVVLLALLAAACGPSREELDARMAAVRAELAAVLGGEAVPAAARGDLEQRRAWKAMQVFYAGDEGAQAATVWVDGTGPLERTDELIAVLGDGDGDGDAEDGGAAAAGTGADAYGSRQLGELRDRARHAVEEESDDLGRRLANLELAASYAFLSRAIHTVQGRVDPASLDVLWFTEGRKAEPLELLAKVRDGAAPADVLSGLEPRHEPYERLLEARQHYLEIVAAGGWGTVPAEGAALEAGASGPRVVALQRRLSAEGDLDRAAGDAETAVYDESVAAAVRRFQERHGLEADGELGGDTLEALNVSAEERLRTLDVNLERWRWMPGELGERHIEVNIPEYRLRAVRGGEVELEMKVIVGKPYHETPAFSDTMTYLVLNPAWNIPESIAGAEVVPKILAQPGYAESLGIEVVTPEGERVPASQVLGHRVVRRETQPDPAPPEDDEGGGFFGRLFGGGGDGDGGVRGQPETVMTAVTTLPEGHRLRQAPGRENPLGQVKFMFPNEHNIYLHDTPADGLFSSEARGFSHGCIRLERPLELADYVLREDGDWPPRRIREVVASGEHTEVPLPEEIAVHLTYFTAWVGDDGRVHFRDDLYGHDARLADALAREEPLTLDLDRLRGAGAERRPAG